jgi:hypothetical protein
MAPFSSDSVAKTPKAVNSPAPDQMEGAEAAPVEAKPSIAPIVAHRDKEAKNKPQTCNAEYQEIACTSDDLRKDFASPQLNDFKTLKLDINHDSILDLLMLGVGGSGGRPALIFIQKPVGHYTYIGEVFGGNFCRDPGPRRDSYPIFYAISRQGICQYTLDATQFEKDRYHSFKSVHWTCVKENDETSGFKVIANKGDWKEPEYQIGAKTMKVEDLACPKASQKLTF